MKNKCPKCGTKRSHGYDLCFTCGYKFFSESRQIPTISDKKVEKSFTTCPHCRQKLPLGAKFCVTCGQKIEVLKPIPSIWKKKVEKSFRICPHCRQKLPLGVKFCVTCGQKIEVLKPIPSISAIKGRNGQKHLNWLKHQYYDLGKTMQDIANDQNVSMMTIRKLLERTEAISEKEEAISMIDLPTLKTEELQPIPQVSDRKEETTKITPTEEVQPRPPVLEKKVEEPKKSSDVEFFPPISDIEEELPKETPAEEVQSILPVLEIKEEKRKKEPRLCKFCGMRIPKNNTFCLQCGMIIKIR